MTDPSNGYEQVAAEFLAGRGRAPATGIGAPRVRDWAHSLPRGATVLDIGCGSGLPITRELVGAGLNVYAIDAAPSMVRAFERNFPNIPVACEAVETSSFFGRLFDGVIAWGLMFLLGADEQRRLIQRLATILVPRGRLLFTSTAQPAVWYDAMTKLESRSLGAEEYRTALAIAGFSVVGEYVDEGDELLLRRRRGSLNVIVPSQTKEVGAIPSAEPSAPWPSLAEWPKREWDQRCSIPKIRKSRIRFSESNLARASIVKTVQYSGTAKEGYPHKTIRTTTLSGLLIRPALRIGAREESWRARAANGTIPTITTIPSLPSSHDARGQPAAVPRL